MIESAIMSGAKKMLALGSSGRLNLTKPYVPSLSRIAARKILPAVGASVRARTANRVPPVGMPIGKAGAPLRKTLSRVAMAGYLRLRLRRRALHRRLVDRTTHRAKLAAAAISTSRKSTAWLRRIDLERRTGHFDSAGEWIATGT